MNKKETIIKNQKGIASMVIVILIMTLLSLIVVSMTKNANREQREALDRQLNSQAFYAAESGINDAKDYYIKHANDVSPSTKAPVKKTKCDGSETHATGEEQFPGYSPKVGEDVNRYSCVLYDATPETLNFSEVSTGGSKVVPLEDANGGTIQTLTFTWKRPNNLNYNFSGCSSNFPPALTDCDAGVLRVELIDPSATSRSALITQNFLSFVLPSSSSFSSPLFPSYINGRGTGNQGVKWRGGCSGGSDGQCTVTINGINKNKLLLHLRSVYASNQVEIKGAKAGGVAIKFKEAQMMVDSTGRASDILKRVQVWAAINEYGLKDYPEFSLQTADEICKLLQIIPPGQPGASSSSGCTL
jgi:type II secretory pathway pseudopilin PulG